MRNSRLVSRQSRMGATGTRATYFVCSNSEIRKKKKKCRYMYLRRAPENLARVAPQATACIGTSPTLWNHRRPSIKPRQKEVQRGTRTSFLLFCCLAVKKRRATGCAYSTYYRWDGGTGYLVAFLVVFFSLRYRALL